MDKKEFYKRYENWCDELFNLGEEAERIINKSVQDHSGFITYDDLYGDSIKGPDWIFIETNQKVRGIIATQLWGVGLKVEDEHGKTITKYLPELAADDKMNIAIQLIEKEF